jgi:APA family basic amino acid/polyamine antiporter
LLRRKSIDKLILDSENPETRLKKTLGPWSLTALGIGAVIGSGIFTVIGTAISGSKASISSVFNTPVADFVVHHTALGGRPGAGPAIAVSLVLVAFVCGLTGLCYAELASMIPIAGSAYTYAYATLGELVAWIIGWDLILEYAGSNMTVSVGFAAHVVDFLDWFGFHPSTRWISPAYLSDGLSDLQGNVLYNPGWHFGFNIPAFLIVLLLTVILVRGIQESAKANNAMVAIKIAAILIFVFAVLGYIHPSNWHPYMPHGWSGVLTGGSIIFFTYIGFDSVSTAAEECKRPQRDLPIGIITTLIVCTVLGGGGLSDGFGAVAVDGGRRGSGGQCTEEAFGAAGWASAALGAADCAGGRDYGDDFIPAGVPVGPVAGVVFDVAGWAAAEDFQQGASALSDSGILDLGGGVCGGDSFGAL